MFFEEFESRRLDELLRFAVVLTGDEGTAQDLVVDVVGHAAVQWDAVLTRGRPFPVVRAALVRAHVADDRVVGSTRPSAEFAALTPVQRAVLSLGAYAGQTDAEIASVLDLPVEQVAGVRDDALRVLGLDSDPESVRLLTDLLDGLADEVRPDTEAVRSAVDAGRDAAAATASGDTAAALFGVAPTATTGTGADAGAVDVAGAAGVTGGAGGAGGAASGAPTYVLDEPDPPVDSDSGAATGEPDPGVPGAGDGDRVPAHRAGARVDHRVGGRRTRAIAAVIGLVVAAVVVSVLVAHTSRTRSAGPAPSAAPTASPSALPSATPGALSAPINVTLPGGRVLGEFFGSGARTVSGAVYSVARGRELMINAICSGSGGATIGPVRLASCTGSPSAAVVTGRQLRSVTVRAGQSVTWRFDVVDSPPLDTDAQLQHPVSTLLTDAPLVRRAAVAAGTGPGTVRLVSGTTGSRVETVTVVLTCTGTGLTVSTGDGALRDGRIGTCYDGWSYEFTVPATVLPGTLTIAAPQTATWRLVAVRG